MNTNSRSVHKMIDQLLHALKMSILYCTLEDVRNLDMAMTNAYRVYYLQFLQENLSEYFKNHQWLSSYTIYRWIQNRMKFNNLSFNVFWPENGLLEVHSEKIIENGTY
jgi:hypothetical protein